MPLSDDARATLAAAVDHAARLDDGPAVAAMLTPLLEHVDPRTADPDPVLAHAGLLLGESSSLLVARRLSWLRYAHTTLSANGTRDYPLAARSGLGCAAILHETGHHREAITVLSDVLAAAEHNGDTSTALLVRAEIVEARHAAGDCDRAYQEISDAWTRWRIADRGDTANGMNLARVYIVVLAGCGRTADARAMAALAVRLFPLSAVFTAELAEQLAIQVPRHRAVCTATPTTPPDTPS